jgi:hypothetical protein
MANCITTPDKEQEIYLFSETFRPALGFSQHPLQGVPAFLLRGRAAKAWS